MAAGSGGSTTMSGAGKHRPLRATNKNARCRSASRFARAESETPPSMPAKAMGGASKNINRSSGGSGASAAQRRGRLLQAHGGGPQMLIAQFTRVESSPVSQGGAA